MPALNPFDPKRDQLQISPAASPNILHHTVWRTWLFIRYSDERFIMVPILTKLNLYISRKRLGECTF